MPRLSPGNYAPCSWLQKSTKPYARKQSTPCLALLLPAVKTAPVWRWSKVIRNRGHPAAQPHSTERRRGAAGSRRGNRRAAKEDTQRDPRSQYNGRMDRASPPKPITSRHRVVFSPLYLFTDKGAPRNHALCAFVLEREGLPPPRPRRRYYPARRMMRGEEGPEVFRLKTKKNLAFRYANPIQTPHRR